MIQRDNIGTGSVGESNLTRRRLSLSIRASRICTLVPILALGVCAGSSLAQILPKVPPAPAPTPVYTPPVPPPAQPAPPAEPEIEAPKLVQRTASGELVTYPQGLERAAVAALSLDAERRMKVNLAIAARDIEIEQFVVANLPKVAEALKVRREVTSITNFDQLGRAKDASAPLRPESLLDRLQREGAIAGLQRQKLDSAITEYSAEQRRDWEKQTGMDVMKIATVVGLQGFNDATREAFAATDRMLQRSIGHLADGQHGVSLDQSQQAALAELNAALKASTLAGNPPGDAEATAKVRGFVFETLSPEQRQALMSRYATPTPKRD